MGINGIGSSYTQNYDVQNRGRSTRTKSATANFKSKALARYESSDDEKNTGFTSMDNRGSIADGKMDYQRIISERKNEIYEKLKNGDTEESFQIGGNSFTEKEWDKLLSEVDDITEEMREAMREEHQKRFAETVEEKKVNQKENIDSTDVISKIVESGSTELKASDFKEFETANYKIVPCNDGVYSCFNIYKNGEIAGAYFYSDMYIRRDSVTGTEVLLSEHGTGAGMYNVIPMDEELKQALKGAMGVDELSVEELTGYSIKTHQGTGIQYVVKNGAEGRGGMPLLRTQRDIEKYNELTQTYMDKYPNLVTSQGMAEMYASFEICGCMHRTETGIMKVFCDSISYNDNNDYKKNWAAKFDDATWDLLYEWLEEHQNRVNDFDKFQSWADILDEIGGTCERIWSDEELLQGYLNN